MEDVPLKRTGKSSGGAGVRGKRWQRCVLGVHVTELKGSPQRDWDFCGTGIGGGLIINGELYSGSAIRRAKLATWSWRWMARSVVAETRLL